MERPALNREVKGSNPLRPANNAYFARRKVLFTSRGVHPRYERKGTMNGIWTDNIDNYEDWEDMTAFADDLPSACMTGRIDDDEMTEEDWDRYGAEFERRYNAHSESVRGSSPRRVSRACGKRVANRYYYDEEDGIGSLLPTEEEIEHYRRALGCDDEYNLRVAVSEMCRPHEDTMAFFFLESQW